MSDQSVMVTRAKREGIPSSIRTAVLVGTDDAAACPGIREKKERPAPQAGFTLIELLMVVAIIGMLTSVVLASFNRQRLLAKDTAIVQTVEQFSRLIELNFLDHNSYAQMQSGWDNTITNCLNSFTTSVHVAKARELCQQVIRLNGSVGTNAFYTGVFAPFTNGAHYSIMAWLPGKGSYFCVGSSGKLSSTQGLPGYTNYWYEPGCANNP